MSQKEAFKQAVADGYTFKGEAVQIGCGMLDNEVVPEAKIMLPLKTMNRCKRTCVANGYKRRFKRNCCTRRKQ
jgi:hypothetical protein